MCHALRRFVQEIYDNNLLSRLLFLFNESFSLLIFLISYHFKKSKTVGYGPRSVDRWTPVETKKFYEVSL